ncbi:MAG: outer membrane beta-barrel protein [Saprospiraceae bacterium]|nr:outer membrane beta-barrel protein [Saprospiraceae bacterium]
MKMKRMHILLMLLSAATFALAQDSGSNKMRFALLGGVNLQTLNGKDFNGDKFDNDLITGFHIGVNAQIPIVPDFYFQPGLLFTTKGAKSTDGDITSTFKLSYIELPLNLVYKGSLGNGFIMLGFGPYVAYGISGKAIYEDGSTSEKIEMDVVFKNVVEINDPVLSPYFKAFDAGGNIFVSYEMAAGIFMQLNTQFGMFKINPIDDRIPGGKMSIKNTGFGLSLGYRF